MLIDQSAPSNREFVSEGIVSKIGNDGIVYLEIEEKKTLLPCYIIRNGNESQLSLSIDDIVIFTTNADNSTGYILGKVERYQPNQPSTSPSFEIDPTNKKQTVIIDGERIRFKANHEIEFRCGNSRFVMSRDGNIVVHGENLTNRARKQNKIKGGSIQVN